MDIFKKPDSISDVYWEFDKETHYKPKLNKGDFFKLSGYDFGWFVLEPISKFIEEKQYETERGKALSYGQKALYYWWYVDAQVRNGGFIQFYFNDCGPYVPTVIKGLEHIGDEKMASLVRQADDVYKKYKLEIDHARENNTLFDGDLYDRLDELSSLDNKYYSLGDKTMAKIEKYIRKNPGEICLDEEGRELNMKFSGECMTYYPDNTIKEIFELDKGKIIGDFKSFYANGNPQKLIKYEKGKETGEKVEYYENGKEEYSVKRDKQQNRFECCLYHENGQLASLWYKLTDKDENVGPFKEWYDNGKLAESGTYITSYEKDGEWLEFYYDGSKKTEAEYKNGELIVNNFWDETGKQLLTNGTGLYICEWVDSGLVGNTNRTETEYKNYKEHGKSTSFINGVISFYQEKENGIEHGITRNYYMNGNLKEETVYKKGEEVSKKTFPMFEHPKVVTEITCEMEDEWMVNRRLETADTYPVPINHKERAEAFNKADFSVFPFLEKYPDHNLDYSYLVSVDENGAVTNLEFSSASNLFIRDEVENDMKQLRFTPATKNGQPVKSISFVIYKFSVGQDTSVVS